MPYVVLSPLASYVFQVGRATMEREVLLANGLHDIACLPERPISREARLDLGEDAQTIKSRGLELFNGDFFNGRFIVATSWATCMSSVQ